MSKKSQLEEVKQAQDLAGQDLSLNAAQLEVLKQTLQSPKAHYLLHLLFKQRRKNNKIIADLFTEILPKFDDVISKKLAIIFGIFDSLKLNDQAFCELLCRTPDTLLTNVVCEIVNLISQKELTLETRAFEKIAQIWHRSSLDSMCAVAFINQCLMEEGKIMSAESMRPIIVAEKLEYDSFAEFVRTRQTEICNVSDGEDGALILTPNDPEVFRTLVDSLRSMNHDEGVIYYTRGNLNPLNALSIEIFKPQNFFVRRYKTSANYNFWSLGQILNHVFFHHELSRLFPAPGKESKAPKPYDVIFEHRIFGLNDFANHETRLRETLLEKQDAFYEAVKSGTGFDTEQQDHIEQVETLYREIFVQKKYDKKLPSIENIVLLTKGDQLFREFLANSRAILSLITTIKSAERESIIDLKNLNLLEVFEDLKKSNPTTPLLHFIALFFYEITEDEKWLRESANPLSRLSLSLLHQEEVLEEEAKKKSEEFFSYCEESSVFLQDFFGILPSKISFQTSQKIAQNFLTVELEKTDLVQDVLSSEGDLTPNMWHIYNCYNCEICYDETTANFQIFPSREIDPRKRSFANLFLTDLAKISEFEGKAVSAELPYIAIHHPENLIPCNGYITSLDAVMNDIFCRCKITRPSGSFDAIYNQLIEASAAKFSVINRDLLKKKLRKNHYQQALREALEIGRGFSFFDRLTKSQLQRFLEHNKSILGLVLFGEEVFENNNLQVSIQSHEALESHKIMLPKRPSDAALEQLSGIKLTELNEAKKNEFAQHVRLKLQGENPPSSSDIVALINDGYFCEFKIDDPFLVDYPRIAHLFQTKRSELNKRGEEAQTTVIEFVEKQLSGAVFKSSVHRGSYCSLLYQPQRGKFDALQKLNEIKKTHQMQSFSAKKTEEGFIEIDLALNYAVWLVADAHKISRYETAQKATAQAKEEEMRRAKEAADKAAEELLLELANVESKTTSAREKPKNPSQPKTVLKKQSEKQRDGREEQSKRDRERAAERKKQQEEAKRKKDELEAEQKTRKAMGKEDELSRKIRAAEKRAEEKNKQAVTSSIPTAQQIEQAQATKPVFTPIPIAAEALEEEMKTVSTSAAKFNEVVNSVLEKRRGRKPEYYQESMNELPESLRNFITTCTSDEHKLNFEKTFLYGGFLNNLYPNDIDFQIVVKGELLKSLTEAGNNQEKYQQILKEILPKDLREIATFSKPLKHHSVWKIQLGEKVEFTLTTKEIFRTNQSWTSTYDARLWNLKTKSSEFPITFLNAPHGSEILADGERPFIINPNAKDCFLRIAFSFAQRGLLPPPELGDQLVELFNQLKPSAIKSFKEKHILGGKVPDNVESNFDSMIKTTSKMATEIPSSSVAPAQQTQLQQGTRTKQ